MKKFLYITMILGISIFFVACGAKDPVETNKPDTSVATNIKITYTKKLAYLPTYNGIEPTEYTTLDKKTGLTTAKYTIKNVADTKVFQDYENILKQDGWTITGSEKSSSIFSKKDTHIANVIIQKSGKDILLLITSK
ncbi:MAG: hypothetical protein ACI8WT_002387 [Clostridium sp.]